MSSDIYIILPSLTPVGPVKGAIALANQLTITNNVTIVVLKPGAGASARIDPTINLIHLYDFAKSTVQKINAYREVLKKSEGYDITVSVSMGFSADFVNFFCKDISLIFSSVRGNLPVNYQMDYGLKGLVLAYFHLFMLRRFKVVTVMTEEMSNQVGRFLGRKPDIIGNFIDETALKPFLQTTKIRTEKIKFVFVGSLSARKCPHLVVDAVKKLHDSGYDVVLDLFGDGPLKSKMLSMVKKYNLSGRVKIHGHVDIPYDIVRSASAFVLPSMSEGVSRAAMESLFLGTPIVMRDVDGNHALVNEGFNGALFKNDNDLPEAMLRAVRLDTYFYQNDLLPECYRQALQVEKFQRLLDGWKLNNYQEYFNYLAKRSVFGYFYRQFFLYPKLASYLDGKILDVGCGIGDFVRYKSDVTGVDINPEIVNFCRSEGLNVCLIVAGDIPFEKNFFNGVILDNVLEHLSDPKELLAEIRRVLKIDGKLLVGVPGKKGFKSDNDHKCFYDLDLLRITLCESGFRYLSSFYTPIQSGWLDKHARQYCLYGLFEKEP